jgi:hypothetical protein
MINRDYYSKAEIHCRDCDGSNLSAIVDLGKQPLANALRKNNSEEEITVPLVLCRCKTCGTIQLNQTVNPDILFSNYVWVTGTSDGAKNFSEIFCKHLNKRLEQKNNFIIEIASNDGTFLRPLMQLGHKVLGVEPAKNIATMASEKGVPTINKFFSKSLAEEIVINHGKADCIFARNVIPHVANAKDVINGIAHCLTEDGIGAIEFHRADIILKDLHYDSIYHEHLYYHSLHSMSRLLNLYNLHSYDIEESPISGGSYVVYFSKRKMSKTVAFESAILKEEALGVSNLEAWINFSHRVIKHRDSLRVIVSSLKEQNKKIIAWGASARSSTLLNFCNFTNLDIDAVLDKSVLKHNLLTPGSNIPILHPDEIKKIAPDVILLLAWNFCDEIIDELKKNYKWSGEIIKPLPNLPQLIQII